ncbi:MAG: hypothetical protein L0L25_10920, partial [Enterococcus sp.]|nr:hypothetical protein [Enterococcus sp.]
MTLHYYLYPELLFYPLFNIHRLFYEWHERRYFKMQLQQGSNAYSVEKSTGYFSLNDSDTRAFIDFLIQSGSLTKTIT